MICPSCSSNIPDEARFCPKCGTRLIPSKQDSLIGTKIDDRYIILELLGEGGSGMVYLARHISLGKRVVIKILHKELMSDETAVKKFQKEAKAVTELENEHIIKILDFGKLPSRQPYTVMEYLKGETLAAKLAERIHFSFSEMLEIISQVCDGLSEAHALGFVHRDIRPRNIMLIERGSKENFVKILDFGLAKILTSPDPSKSAIGLILGDPTYTAPEQIKTEGVDLRTDIYSLGIIVYQMLSGILPYTGNTVFEIMGKHLDEPYPPLERKLPFLPKGIDAILSKAMAKNKEDRFATVLQFQKALAELKIPSSNPEKEKQIIKQQHDSFINMQYQYNAEPGSQTPALIRIAGGGAVRVQNMVEPASTAKDQPNTQTKSSDNKKPDKQPNKIKAAKHAVAMELTPPPIQDLDTMPIKENKEVKTAYEQHKQKKTGISEQDTPSEEQKREKQEKQENIKSSDKHDISPEESVLLPPSETFIARENEIVERMLREKRKERKMYLFISVGAILLFAIIYYVSTSFFNDDTDVSVSDEDIAPAVQPSKTTQDRKTKPERNPKTKTRQKPAVVVPPSDKTDDKNDVKPENKENKTETDGNKTVTATVSAKTGQNKVVKSSKTPKTKKQPEIKIPKLNTKIKKTPGNNTVTEKLKEAKTLYNNGQMAAAFKKYKEVLALSPDNYSALIGFSNVGFELGKFSQVEKKLMKAVQIKPSARNWYKLGAVRQRLGKISGAKRAYNKSLAVNPGYKPALNALNKLN